ncbi:hypothetical protein ACFP2T_23770 [Plantactinospora solaniradicis]|uniref:Uncharacterized protein n=1 Tax=Plantactinospora solaniradicis TaxID=1723736 RepID=A0ABW1KCF0_9ACTN
MAAEDRGRAPAAAGMPQRQVYGLVALLLMLSNVPLVCLVVLWPEPADLAGPSRLHLLNWSSGTISPEQRILLCVAFCGLLGGSIRMLLRIRGDFTSPQVESRYIPWYFLTPPIGAILAVGFYLVVRGGFLASGTSVENVNVFAFGGTGVLVGLFAEVAADRLEGAFSGGFSARRRRRPRPSEPDGPTEE